MHKYKVGDYVMIENNIARVTKIEPTTLASVDTFWIISTGLRTCDRGYRFQPGSINDGLCTIIGPTLSPMAKVLFT